MTKLGLYPLGTAPPDRPDPSIIADRRCAADAAKAVYEQALDAQLACTARSHARGMKCPTCAEVGILRIAWLRSEAQVVIARAASGLVETDPLAELTAVEATTLERQQLATIHERRPAV